MTRHRRGAMRVGSVAIAAAPASRATVNLRPVCHTDPPDNQATPVGDPDDVGASPRAHVRGGAGQNGAHGLLTAGVRRAGQRR